MKRARFVYWQELGDSKTLPVFAVPAEGGRETTVSEQTLYQNGIEIPKYPDFETWKDGVVRKKRCRYCWAIVRTKADMEHHLKQHELANGCRYPVAAPLEYQPR